MPKGRDAILAATRLPLAAIWRAAGMGGLAECRPLRPLATAREA